jgi:hypothetical protein
MRFSMKKACSPFHRIEHAFYRVPYVMRFCHSGLEKAAAPSSHMKPNPARRHNKNFAVAAPGTMMDRIFFLLRIFYRSFIFAIWLH